MTARAAVAVTGAWSYSGRVVAARLLERGYAVRSLTSRPVPDPDPHGGQVEAAPYGAFDVRSLARSLRGVDALYCGYWTRHDRPPIGHRGPWTSHQLAVERSRALAAAAVEAGVRRLVWTSIANPGLDPDLPYYAGKAAVEASVRSCGIPYAILRPACFFGGGGILVENIAWAARRMPVVPIPAGPAYRIRPIHVDDFAQAVVAAIESSDSFARDATGPERPEFGAFVRQTGLALTGRPARVVRLPMAACRGLYAAASLCLRETVLTSDELVGLARNRLDSTAEPMGRIELSAWVRANAAALGRAFVREPRRTMTR